MPVFARFSADSPVARYRARKQRLAGRHCAHSTQCCSRGPRWRESVSPVVFVIQGIALFPGCRARLSPRHESEHPRIHRGSFFGGYANAVGNLHAWADGDPFIVNYVGHPIPGAVCGFIWIHNDPRYRTAEIGRNRHYWTGRLRAMAFAWAYSEQFEIGPISAASIGHVQAYFPQQGFVDHVITPTVGMG